MNHLSQLTIRYMTKNHKRTFTTLVGVILSALLIFMLFEVTYSVIRSRDEQAYQSKGGADIAGYVSIDQARSMKSDFRNGKNLAGNEVTSFWVEVKSSNRPVIISSFADMAYPITVSHGELPKSLNEVAVCNRSEGSNYKVGDTYIDEDPETGEKVSLKVVGLYGTLDYDPALERYGTMNSFLSDVITCFSDEEFEAFQSEKQVYAFIKLKDTDKLDDKAAAISAAYGCDISPVHEALIYYGQDTEASLSAFGRDAILLVVSFVVAVFLMVIIRNAFNISVDERLKDYGILRCIGLTRSQIFKMIILEAVLIALIGCVIGIGLGYLINALGIKLVNGLPVIESVFGYGINMHAVFSIKAVIITLAMVFLTTTLSMVSPIIKLYKMSPIAAQRKMDNVKRPKESQSLLKKMGGKIEIAYGIRSAKRTRGRFFRTVITYALGLALVVGFGAILQTMLKTEYPAVYTYDYKASYTDSAIWAESVKTLNSSDTCVGAEGFLSYVDLEKNEDGHGSLLKYGIVGISDKLWQYIVDETGIQDMGVQDGKVSVLRVVPTLGREPVYQVGDDIKVKHSDTVFHVTGDLPGGVYDLLLSSNAGPFLSCEDGIYVYHESLDAPQFTDYKPGVLLVAENGAEVKDSFLTCVLSAEGKPGQKQEMKELMEKNSAIVEPIQDFFSTLSLIRVIIIVVLSFLLFISVVNAINVERGLLNARKDEIKTLRLIGMSEKQRQKMLFAENMTAAVLAAIIGPIIGILAALGVCMLFYRGNGLTGSFDSFTMSIHFGIDWLMTVIGIVLILLSGALVTLFNRKD